MKDLIYRQAAIDALEKWESSFTWDSWCNEHKGESEEYHITAPSAIIANLPSAVPHWIPCSERLPETYGEYIVTRKTEYGIKTTTSLYYENGIWWPPEEVIAWKYLPRPYRGEE